MHSDMVVSAKQDDHTKCLNRFVEKPGVMVHGPVLQKKRKPEAIEEKLDWAA